MDETKQREGLGGNEATSFATPPTCSECTTQRISTSSRWRSGYASGAPDTRNPCHPFKRPAAPAPISRKAGGGQDARTARRLRRSATKASKRSGGGPGRSSDAAGFNSSTVPELYNEPAEPNEYGQSGYDPAAECYAEFETAERGVPAFDVPEDHEGPVL